MEGMRIVEIGGRRVIRVGAFIEATSLFHAVGYKRPRHLVSHLRCQRQPFPDVPHTHIQPAVKVSREMWALLASLEVPGFVAPARYHGASQTALLAPLGVTDLVATSPRNSAQRTDLQAFNRALWSAGQVEVEEEEGFDPCPEEETPNPPPPPTADEEPQGAEAEPKLSDAQLDITCKAMMTPEAPDGFPVCFDLLWAACGYSQKRNAVYMLASTKDDDGEDLFVRDEDFCVVVRKSTGGRPPANYYVTTDTAQHMAMMARTKIGKRVRRAFIRIATEWSQGRGRPQPKATPSGSFEEQMVAVMALNQQVMGMVQGMVATRRMAEDAHKAGLDARETAERVERHTEAQIGVLAEEVGNLKASQFREEWVEKGRRLFKNSAADVAEWIGIAASSGNAHGDYVINAAKWLGLISEDYSQPNCKVWVDPVTRADPSGKNGYITTPTCKFNASAAEQVKALHLRIEGPTPPSGVLVKVRGDGLHVTFGRNRSGNLVFAKAFAGARLR